MDEMTEKQEEATRIIEAIGTITFEEILKKCELLTKNLNRMTELEKLASRYVDEKPNNDGFYDAFVAGYNAALRQPPVISSFVCGHPPKQTYLNDGVWHCEKCNGKWNSIANK